MYTQSIFESQKILDKILPQSVTTDATGSYTSVKGFQRFCFNAMIGAIAAGAGVTVRIRQAKDGSGTAVKALKTDTALVDTDDGQVIGIDVRSEELDVDGGFDFVRIEVIVTGAAAVLVSGQLIGYERDYLPSAVNATNSGFTRVVA